MRKLLVPLALAATLLAGCDEPVDKCLDQKEGSGTVSSKDSRKNGKLSRRYYLFFDNGTCVKVEEGDYDRYKVGDHYPKKKK